MPPFFVPVLWKTPGHVGKAGIPVLWRGRDTSGRGGYPSWCRSWGRRAAGNRMVRDRGRAGFCMDRKAERTGEALCPKPGVPQGVEQPLPSAGAGSAAGRGKAGYTAAVRPRIKKAACRVRGRPWSPPVAGGPAPRGVGAGGGSFKRGDYCFCTVMERAAGASGCLRGMTMVSTPFLWLALMFSTSASSARPIWRQKEP